MFAAKNTAAPSGEAVYIESVFSTYLYTGTGSSQTITNNIDTSTKGGLVWIKGRSGATGHRFTDTVRGATKSLESNSTAAEATESTGLTAFGTTGFTIGADADYNTNAATYASWTFRKQAKFFDVVTYTGNGTNRTIAHNLGSVPGCIMVKRTDTVGAWQVYHRSLANTQYLVLNTTALVATGATRWNSTTPTSTEFSLGTDATVNASGGSYVAYLFAHDAGGFGATGSDNVISCGSYTGNATLNSINLGYEPQFLIIKRTSGTADVWLMIDVMRGLNAGSSNVALCPNTGSAEAADVGIQSAIRPTATGFDLLAADAPLNANASNYIYIAIRRGPMKTPTSGTSVFGNSANTSAIDASNAVVFNPEASDLWFNANRANYIYVLSKLNGWRYLVTQTTANENTSYTWEQRTQTDLRPTTTWWSAGQSQVNWFFKRAPGFFDVVCYTGTGSNRTVTHNLTVAPQLIITKKRSGTSNWAVNDPTQSNPWSGALVLNKSDAFVSSSAVWNNTAPTSSVFSVGTADATNVSGDTYVAYLFASVTGVSKVGSYTGTGTTLQVDCGFTAGARFVMIKRTDSTGDWYVWDSARGIVSGNDPYLLMNSAAAEVTNTDYIDPLNAGFEISSTAPAAINANGGTFIFLAIA